MKFSRWMFNIKVDTRDLMYLTINRINTMTFDNEVNIKMIYAVKYIKNLTLNISLIIFLVSIK